MTTSRCVLLLSALLAFASSSIASTGITERVSVSSTEAEADSYSDYPSISADGRYVAFHSLAANLVAGDSNWVPDVFVRDWLAGTTERVSVSSAEAEADMWSSYPSISANGRYVAFTSSATNLVPGDTNGYEDVFVRDRLAGTTERVSVSSAEAEADGYSYSPSISADGRYVAFRSSATNLVPGDTNGYEDVFVRDRLAGTTERVSVSSAEAQGNGGSYWSAISADGRYVTFESGATNLVAGDTNGQMDVFVRDRVSGETERVSVSSAEAQGNGWSWFPSISADGWYVAFRSDATNLVAGDTNEEDDVFVRDRLAGTTERVSVSSAEAEADSYSDYSTSISADGRYVAFISYATNLVPGDTNGYEDVFVRDRLAGTTERVSVSSAEAEGNNHSVYPSISADGRYVAFQSLATNLVAGDTNVTRDIFVRGPLAHAMPEVVLEVHPNERAQGYGGGPKLGTQCWTSSGLTGPFYLWKQYRFDGSANLWIQVCAQNFNNLQNSSGKGDMLQLKIDSQVPDDVWGIMTGWSGVAQWRGDNEHGDRYTLEFQPPGLSPGQHVLKLAAKETPIIWWIKVTDLEAEVVYPPE